MIRVNVEKANKKKANRQSVLILTAVMCIPVLLWIWYHTVTPQDRYFIKLEESDIKYIFIFNGRTGHSEKELTGNDRQEVVEQLLDIWLKGGWTVLDVQNGGSVKLYHIVLTDGREFDFGALPHHETGPDRTLRACPYYIINGIRAYRASKKDMELVEQMNETWQRLTEQYDSISGPITDISCAAGRP